LVLDTTKGPFQTFSDLYYYYFYYFTRDCFALFFNGDVMPTSMNETCIPSILLPSLFLTEEAWQG
jgi:hypothetical protein